MGSGKRLDPTEGGKTMETVEGCQNGEVEMLRRYSEALRADAERAVNSYFRMPVPRRWEGIDMTESLSEEEYRKLGLHEIPVNQHRPTRTRVL